MIKYIFQLIRIKDWWNYIIPPVLGAVYFVILLDTIDVLESYRIISLWFVSIIGTAAFGFTLNDFFDTKDDIKKGKLNSLGLLPKHKQVIIIVFSLCLAITPIIYLKLSLISNILICFQYILLFLYSVPPFRFKNNTYVSTIFDSLYSGLIFILAILLSDIEISHIVFDSIPLVVFIPLLFFFRGFRNILNHHIKDSPYDMVLNTANFALKFGNKITMAIIKTILVFEIIFVFGVLLFIPFPFIKFAIGFILISLIYFVLKLFDIKNRDKNTLDKIQLINDFYEDLLPLFFLILLSLNDMKFLLVLTIHLLLFRNKFVSLLLVKLIYGIVFRKSCGLINRIFGTNL